MPFTDSQSSPTLHTSHRAQRRYGVAPLVMLAALASLCVTACTPHPGSAEIAFLRDGHLWTVYSDGTGATEIAQGGVVSMAWSPDHHQIVLRYAGKAATSGGAVSAPDAVSDLAVVGVDGGSPVQITPSISGMARSDAWWDANGNRLLYREGFSSTPGQEPATVVYVLSQSDQPEGIARKPLLDTALMPALAPDGSQVAVVDAEGDVRIGLPGAAGKIVASGALLTLPGSGRPARLLWRPRHDELLYAAAGTGGATRLTLSTLAGSGESSLDLANLIDYAFSPDGTKLLVQTSSGFAVWPLNGSHFAAAPRLTWAEVDATVLAWWSPTSEAVLVQDHLGYTLSDLETRRVTPVLRTTDGSLAASSAPSWHPLGASPWDASGDAFVFRASGGTWRGTPLAPAHSVAGLYVGKTASSSGPPTLVDSGDDWAPSWSSLAPGASWLTPS